MIEPSATHAVLIPSFDTGPLVYATVREARLHWSPVWVVVDGSTDGTAQGLRRMAEADAALRVLVLDRNQGKGSAVLHGLRALATAGYSHVLTMDADGQHPAAAIAAFMAASMATPTAMVLCRPVFDASAPRLRVRGRRISNWWANLETLWSGIGDSLSGFRVYPIEPLRQRMERTRWMRRFDFDPEAAVKLCWDGVDVINLAAPVRYLRADEGGVSHFRYGRDNLLLTAMHVRLMLGLAWRWPLLLRRRRTRRGRTALGSG